MATAGGSRSARVAHRVFGDVALRRRNVFQPICPAIPREPDAPFAGGLERRPRRSGSDARLAIAGGRLARIAKFSRGVRTRSPENATWAQDRRRCARNASQRYVRIFARAQSFRGVPAGEAEARKTWSQFERILGARRTLGIQRPCFAPTGRRMEPG